VSADGTTEELWRSHQMSGGFCGAVLRDGVLYGLDRGVLSAQKADTGEILWSAGDFGYGQVLLADDLLIVTGDKGQVALVRARPDAHEELGRMQALEGLTWNVPTLTQGKLLVRNSREMAAFDLTAQ
jgi:outer membrane protein assembly factor BamB